MEMKQRRTIGVVENPADMNGMNAINMMNMCAAHPMGMYNPKTGFGGSYGYNYGMPLNNWQSINNNAYAPFVNNNNGYVPTPFFGCEIPAPFPNNTSTFYLYNRYGAHQQTNNTYMNANMNPMNNMHTPCMNDNISVGDLSQTRHDNTQEMDNLSQSCLDDTQGLKAV
eukprot:15353853-Ditylum_brightwellii.AAC.1